MRKYVLILGSLLLLLVIFTVLSLSSKDAAKAELAKLIINEPQIEALSDEATSRASSYGLKVVAANAATLSSSNVEQFSIYYKNHFGKVPKPPKLSKDQNPVEKLKAAEDGSAFDGLYTDLLKQSLEADLGIMQNIVSQTKQSALKELIGTTIASHTSLLEQLNDLR